MAHAFQLPCAPAVLSLNAKFALLCACSIFHTRNTKSNAGTNKNGFPFQFIARPISVCCSHVFQSAPIDGVPVCENSFNSGACTLTARK